MHFHFILADVGFGPFVPHPQEAVNRLNDGDPSLRPSDFSTVDQIMAMIEDNVVVLNKAFADTPFTFNFVVDATTQTTNTTWTVYASEFASQMSSQEGSSDLEIMDVFLNFRLQQLTDWNTVTI